MCMVSALNDYGRNRIPQQQWTADTFKQFQQILELLKGLDTKLDQPDCEVEEKTAWMLDVERRIQALEDAKADPQADGAV